MPSRAWSVWRRDSRPRDAMTVGTRGYGFVSYVWTSSSVWARLIRVMLSPLSGLFRFIVARRNSAFDARIRTGQLARPALPALSVGNLTVGGTGKTPVASWFVSRLREAGAAPAVVLRGYGDDEWRVHGLLTPGIPVVVAAERTVGLEEARRLHCDCAVLDDAFQHRQVARLVDVVLVSADAWRHHVHLLPSGPYREPLSSLRRASVIVITIKAALPDHVRALYTAVQAAAPSVPIAQLRLVPGAIRLAATMGAVDGSPTDHQHELAWLGGRQVVLVSAIADPGAFRRQVEEAGAVVRHHAVYPDHHQYSPDDLTQITGQAAPDLVVLCTLKDAVKLVALWPRAGAALWYVSQTVVVEQGADILDQAIGKVLEARRSTTPTAG